MILRNHAARTAASGWASRHGGSVTRITNDKTSADDVWEWYFLALEYLGAAEQLVHAAPRRVVPAVYSYRHGMELFLKFVRLATGGEVARVHDVERLRSKIGEVTISQAQLDALRRLLPEVGREELEEAINWWVGRELDALGGDDDLTSIGLSRDVANTDMRYPSADARAWVGSLSDRDVNDLSQRITDGKIMILMFVGTFWYEQVVSELE